MKCHASPVRSARSGRAVLVAVLLFALLLILVGVWFGMARSSGSEVDPAADQLARELAAAHFAADDRAEMAAAIAPLVERADPDPEDLASAAAIALRMADIDAARAYLNRAVALDPDSPRVQYNLARIKREWDLDYAGAVPHLERVLREQPDDVPAVLMLADTLDNLERSTEAEPLYRQVVALGVDEAGSWYMTALYRLARLARENGDDERATALDQEFQLLAGRGLEAPPEKVLNIGLLGGIPMPAPRGNVPEGTGELPELLVGSAAPGELAGATRLLAADLDNDGFLDLVGWGPEGLAIALNAKSGWSGRVLSSLAVDHVLAYDLGNDDDLDLLLVSGNELSVLVAEPGAEEGSFTWRTVRSLPSLPSPAADLLAVDYDHEGDLDLLFVGDFGARLLRDDGAPDPAGGYTDVTLEAGLPMDRAFAWCLIEDFDTDQDVDLLLGGPEGLFLASNARGGRFDDESARAGAVNGLEREPLAADLDGDGRPDLWGVSGGRGRIWLNGPSAELRPREGYDVAAPVPSAGPLLALDLDLDGALDVVWNADGVLAGRLALGLAEETELISTLPGPTCIADLAGERTWTLVVLDEDGVTLEPTQPKNNCVRLGFRGNKDNRRGLGAVVELRAGPIYRRVFWQGEAELLGVGRRSETDLVRVTWPNGVIQYDTKRELGDRAATGDALGFLQNDGLMGSCPFLYTWNGERFEFISDVLGITPLGLPMAPGVLVVPDHDEYVLVHGEQLRERDGFLELQFTEELREVTYLDRVRLDVIDHPEGTEIYPDERFCFPPFPAAHTHSVRAPLAPLRALDARGNDWADALAAIDGEHARPFDPAPPQIQGIAEPHVLDLEFDAAALAGAEKLRLVMTGWLYWSNASVNMAIARDPRYQFVPPMLQVPDGEGGWRDTGPPVGFPAGKTKSMVIDVSDLLVRGDPRIRVFSTLRLYWDSIRLAIDDDDAELRTTSLEPASAELWRRGFSEPLADERPDQPERFVWERVSTIPRWNPHPGYYTRLGDVLPLLGEVDDRFAILASGDALHVRFDAGALPPVPAGFRRDYLVYLDGWAKDRDPNTVEALNVEPLPFHGMSGYPYGPDESFPDTERHRAWRREWNTRLAEPWLPRLAGAAGEL